MFFTLVDPITGKSSRIKRVKYCECLIHTIFKQIYINLYWIRDYKAFKWEQRTATLSLTMHIARNNFQKNHLNVKFYKRYYNSSKELQLHISLYYWKGNFSYFLLQPYLNRPFRRPHFCKWHRGMRKVLSLKLMLRYRSDVVFAMVLGCFFFNLLRVNIYNYCNAEVLHITRLKIMTLLCTYLNTIF